MPSILEARVAARENAEKVIFELLQQAHGPVNLSDLLFHFPTIDEATVRRAILRLAAEGRAVIDSNSRLRAA